MADTTPLAQAHPTEVWAALGALGGMLVLLVGTLYQRINKDIDGSYTDQIALRDDFEEEIDGIHSRCDTQAKECNSQFKDLSKDINGVGTEVARIGQQIAQFATSSTFTNEELDRLCNDIKDLNKRLQTIEVEHKHCIRLHQNLLGGNNDHH